RRVQRLPHQPALRARWRSVPGATQAGQHEPLSGRRRPIRTVHIAKHHAGQWPARDVRGILTDHSDRLRPRSSSSAIRSAAAGDAVAGVSEHDDPRHQSDLHLLAVDSTGASLPRRRAERTRSNLSYGTLTSGEPAVAYAATATTVKTHSIPLISARLASVGFPRRQLREGSRPVFDYGRRAPFADTRHARGF